MTTYATNLQRLENQAAVAIDRLRDLRGQYEQVIRSARANGADERANALQATWDAARAPHEAVIAERDAFVAGT